LKLNKNRHHILNYFHSRRVSCLFSILALSIFAISLQQATALEILPPVFPGDNTVNFRDITNLVNASATVSLDKSIYLPGDSATLTITDVNANADLTSRESLTVVVSSVTDPIGIIIFPEETDVNTGVFLGTFSVSTSPSFDTTLQIRPGDSLTISYEPQAQFAGRLSAQLSGIDVEGLALLFDYVVSDDEEINNCFVVVTDAVHFEMLDAGFGTPTATSTVVTMSFANAFIGGNSGTPTIFNQAATEGVWLPLTTTIDLDALTITTNEPITGGNFVIGFPDPSCSGGGGGGLVRPGLVLNLLAGLGVGGGGPDRYPPSLNYGTPKDTQDSFGGILITDDNTNSFPLVINGKGYYLPTFSTTIESVQVNTGQDVNLSLTFLESTSVEHVALHLVDENNDEISENDPTITVNKDTITKSDPDQILSDDITFSKSKDGNKYSFNFGFSFDQPGNRHLMIKAWDSNKNSGNTKVFNAFSVSGEPIPDEGVGHMIYLDLGAFFITPDGIWMAGEKVTAAQPVIEYVYPDYVGRTERHDGMVLEIENEKTRASLVASERFDLETQTFVEEKKQLDTRRAPDLSLTTIGHKIRDFTLSPQENKELIKELAWIEHLKAQKILDLMYPNLRN
jgi:hypothetical protein